MSALLGVTALAVAIARPPFQLVRALAHLRGDLLFHVPTNERLVALTLDDGPHEATTPAVLEVLRRHRAHATFFLIGERARRWPELVHRIVEDGHEVGNHLWAELATARLTVDEFRTQLGATEAVLSPAATPRLLRPGSGWIGRRKAQLARDHGYACVLGTIYPYDAHIRVGPRIARDVAARVRPGAIVVLHEGSSSRVNVASALEVLLEALRRRGYEVTSVSELLQRSGMSDAGAHRPRRGGPPGEVGSRVAAADHRSRT